MATRAWRVRTIFLLGIGFVLGLAASVPLRAVYRRATAQPPPVPRPHVRLRHEAMIQRPKPGHVEIAFLGDSLTEYWKDQALWDKRYAGRSLNLGIAGDTAGGLLWRIRNGALAGVSPKAVVVMIGTNDLEQWVADSKPVGWQVVGFVSAILGELTSRAPGARVVLMGVPPRDGAEANEHAAWVNQKLAAVARSNGAEFVDLTPRLTGPDGKVPAEIMPDGVHLSPAGYVVWDEAIAPLLK